ncbi:MAG: TonB-dependent receptor domain-containing protein [Myxococcota bacterium]
MIRLVGRVAVWLSFFHWILSSSPAEAQVALQVVVLDSETKEPIANLEVHLKNLSTGSELGTTTDGLGVARFSALETSGRWQATTAETERYVSARSEPISLRSSFDAGLTLLVSKKGKTEEVDPELKVVIEGSSLSARLNTSNAEVSSTLSKEDIKNIPVEARDLERVLFRLPFVTRATGFFQEAPTIAINGANALYTNYTIDGLDNNENFLGGQRFPIPVGMVQDVTVLANNYSVEFGRTANGVVNVTTRSGGNEWKGEAFFVTRPGLTASQDGDFPQSDLLGNPVNLDFQRYQFGGSLGGPIVKDRTFVFVNAEFTLDLLDNELVVPDLGIDEVIRGDNQTLLLTARLDQVWTDRLRTTLRVNHGRAFNELPGGGVFGGVTFPSAGTEQERLSLNTALSTSYRGDGWSYTGAFQYARFDWDFRRPLNGPGPQTTLRNPTGQTIGILGHPGFIFDEVENNFQTQHKFQVQVGNHRLKFGVDVIVGVFDLVGGGNINGNALVDLSPADLDALIAQGVDEELSPADINVGTVVNNFFETQPNSFGTSQEIYGLYIEDQIQLTSSLSTTLGLRWDYDSLSTANGAADGDFDNIAPRGSINWSPRPNLVVRGGLGLFYEKIPYAIVSDAIQQSTTSAGFLMQLEELQARGIIDANTDLEDLVADGNFAVDGVANDCDSADSCFGLRDTAEGTPEFRIQNPEGLSNPFALQATVGAQWQLARNWLASIDLVYTRGFNLVRLVDLNAAAPFAFNQALFEELGPEGVAELTAQEREELGLVRSVASANASRPAPILPGGARSIIVSDTGGRSRYRAMNVALYKNRDNSLWDWTFFYTLSRLENDTDDINFRASDANNFDADFGPSLNDRTHVFSTIFNVYPVKGLSVTTAILLQSGQPINFVADAEVFGTTDINGDGLSFADQFTGNPDRFPGEDRNSGRLDWSLNVDLGVQYAFRLLGAEFVFRSDVFNLFNLNIESGFPTNFTVSNQIQIGGDAEFVQNSADLPLTVQFTLLARF